MTLRADWYSGGVHYEVTAEQEAGETWDAFKARFDQAVADMKATYPPDGALKKG